VLLTDAFSVDFAEMFNIPGVDRLSLVLVGMVTLLEGPVGGFLLAIWTFTVLTGDCEGEGVILALPVSRAGKSSD